MSILYQIAYTKQDLEKAYHLRFKVLRAPWNQPKGSEVDSLEATSQTWIVLENSKVIATARIQKANDQTSQLRYMAVDPVFQGSGIGIKLLNKIEFHIKNEDSIIKFIIFNARENSVPFYLKWGAVVVEEGEMLFDSIRHFKMIKKI